MSPENQRVAIGKDCCGKEIIPLLGKKLEVRTNRHTTTDGYLWGWIEGTTANTVWGDDHKFNHAAAVTLVRDYNAKSSAKHEANTAKSVSPTSPTTEESSAVAERKLELALNAIRIAVEQFERVNWGWEGDCGSKNIMRTLEEFLPTPTQPQ